MEKKGFNEADWILKSLAFNVSKLRKRLARPNIDEESIEKVRLETGKLVDQLKNNPESKKEINEKIKDLHKDINDEDFGLCLARAQLEKCANFITVLRKSNVKDRKHYAEAVNLVIMSIYFAGSFFDSPYETIKSLRELKPLAETGKKLKDCGGRNKIEEDKKDEERDKFQNEVNDLMRKRKFSFTSALTEVAKKNGVSISTLKRRGVKNPG